MKKKYNQSKARGVLEFIAAMKLAKVCFESQILATAQLFMGLFCGKQRKCCFLDIWRIQTQDLIRAL